MESDRQNLWDIRRGLHISSSEADQFSQPTRWGCQCSERLCGRKQDTWTTSAAYWFRPVMFDEEARPRFSLHLNGSPPLMPNKNSVE